MAIDFTESVSQGVFGALVGLPQPHIAGLVARGVLREGDSVAEWMRAYTKSLRDELYGRGGDVTASRRQLYDAQKQKIDLENGVRTRQLVEGDSVRGAAAVLAQRIVQKLDSREARLPDALVGRTRHEIQRHLAGVFNELRSELAVDAESLAAQFAPQGIAQ